MKILFITATRIGDAVLSTGVLSELNRRHPGAAITVACGPLAASLFRAFPGVVDVIALDKRPFAGHWFDLWRRTRAVTWDLIVDLRRSLIPFVLGARASKRLGPTDNTRHRAEFLPSVIGVDHALEPVIPDPGGDSEGRTDIVAVAPMAARADKTWPLDRFVELARRLLAGPCTGHRLAIVGGPGEDAIADAFDGVGAHLVRMIGNPELTAVAAFLRRARIFIANDSGTAHLAAAAGAPTVALFGPTEPRNYAPRGRFVRVVRAPLEDGVRSMSALTVDQVLPAVTELLASTAAPRY